MSCTATVDVGTPSPEFAAGLWSVTEVRYHGFADLPVERDVRILSPEFTCFGRRWKLGLYPGGTRGARDGMVGLFIYNLSWERVQAVISFGIKNSDCEEVHHLRLPPTEYPPNWSSSKLTGKGLLKFERSTLLNYLVDGALVIDVKLKLAEPTNKLPYLAANPFCSTMLNLFMDEGTADITFEVEGQAKRRIAKEDANTATTNSTFHAHRFILQNCAPQLAEMCGPGGNDTPVPINDVKPDIFRHLLYYIYGGKVSFGDMTAQAKEIIDAADKYGVPNLKLEAETCYVNTTEISVDIMMDNLLYADAKNCALLREVVVDFIVENSVEVMRKVSFEDAPAIITDVLAAIARGNKNGESNDDGSDQFDALRISDLRWRAHERGLNVDGSREALIATLHNDSGEDLAH